MAKLYFKYGAMGSSKSAQALITQFNYEELGMSVWLIKPSTDTRDGADIIRSRIGLERRAQVITPEQDICEEYHRAGKHDVIIADEAQFFTPEQIDQLRSLVDNEDLPVLCFGLRTDFLTHFFPGADVNPLGNWTGGSDVDSGATNRKLGSDMGDSVTGGGLHGKDLSKADISVNIYAWLKAQTTGRPVEMCCAIGDEKVDGVPYEDIMLTAKMYVKQIGGFEAFAEWGLIR